MLLSLTADVLERVASFVSKNDVALGLRLTCKAFASQFNESQSSIVPWEPVPVHSFAEHCSRHGMRCWTRARRLCFISHVAASGVADNLTMAVVQADCSITKEQLYAAARAGQLEASRWLLSHNDFCEKLDIPCVLLSAAEGGNLELCKLLLEEAAKGGSNWGKHYPYPFFDLTGMGLLENAKPSNKGFMSWLFANGMPWDDEGPADAARRGDWDMAEWLLQQHAGGRAFRSVLRAGEFDYTPLPAAAAAGCSLAALKRAHALAVANGATELANFPYDEDYDAVTAAARSVTPDWREKLIWLTTPLPEGAGLERKIECRIWDLHECEALSRVQWMRAAASAPFQVHMSPQSAAWCARRGHVSALLYHIRNGVQIDARAAEDAVAGGHLHVLQVLQEHCCPMPYISTLRLAVRCGQLDGLRWLVDEKVVGPRQLLTWRPKSVNQSTYRERYEYEPRNLVEVALHAGHLAVAQWLAEQMEGLGVGRTGPEATDVGRGQGQEQEQQQGHEQEPGQGQWPQQVHEHGGGQRQEQEEGQGQEQGQQQEQQEQWAPGLTRRGIELQTQLMTAAAAEGRMEVVVWMQGRGCTPDEETFAAAVKAGHVELVAWLVERGCPMPVRGTRLCGFPCSWPAFLGSSSSACAFSAVVPGLPLQHSSILCACLTCYFAVLVFQPNGRPWHTAARVGDVAMLQELHRAGLPLPERMVAEKVSGRTRTSL